MSAIPDDFVKKTTELSADVTRPFPNSRRIYVEGSRPDIRVPMREVSQADTPASFGVEKNPPITVYDTSGPYTDPAARIDLMKGLPEVRTAWIDERADTEELPGPSSEFGRQRQSDPELAHLRFEHIRRPRVARAGSNVTQMHYARKGIVTPEMEFVALRENATLSSPFLVLKVLSVLLALTGLYANSAPVIIGAMILAPLMSPIVSLAMGLARTEVNLIRNSLQTLGAGIGAGLFCAIIVAWIMPLENMTTEMHARVAPTLLDLSVAIISGIAGAYAHAKEEIAKSLAGVAIAVALVPPLSVAGIGFGWGDWSMARGASLLFITNLVGIALAASATFLVLGFAPFKLAKKGIAITLVLMAVITVPLYIAFIDLVDQGRIVRQIPTGQIELAGEPVGLRIVKVRTGRPPLVRVIMSSSKQLDTRHVDALKELIIERVGRTVLVEAQLNLRR